MSGRAGERLPLEVMLAEAAAGEPDHRVRMLLAFEAGGAVFAVKAAEVEVIVERGSLARLPSSPEGVVGVASVHGRMRLVVAFGGDTGTRLIALHGDAQTALLADRILGVAEVHEEEIHPASDDARALGRLVWGDREALLLDPGRLIRVE